MRSELVREFEIKNSKTDLPVPVVDGVHLHSIYNPKREAESFAKQNEVQLGKNNCVLIFGLGFGYHIEQIEFKMNQIHGENYRIFIVEPNRKIVDYCVKNGLFTPTKQKRVFCYGEIKNYFGDRSLVSFLSKKPSVIPHPASFNLNETFFKTFMTYKASTKLSDVTENISSPEISEYINNFGGETLFDEFIEAIDQKAELSTDDLLILAFKEIATTNGHGARNE